MPKFSQSNPPPRVLMLSPTATPVVKTTFNYTTCVAFFKSIGCHIAEYEEADMSASDQVFRDEWDLLCVPNIANSNDYGNLQTTLALFDTVPPCFIANAVNVALSGASKAVTGIQTVDASPTPMLTQPQSLENWQGRKSGQVSFYSKAALTWLTDVTIHAQDASNKASLTSRTISGSNTLFQIGGTSATLRVAKPWIGAQWMVDQVSSARAIELKAHIKKRHCKLRLDGLSDTNSQAAHTAGDLDTIYDSLVSFGIKEAWVATIWGSSNSSDTLDTTNTAVLDWFLARAESSVGDGSIFRVTNHETDVYDGTGIYDGNTERCSSDLAATDQFKAASYCYKWACDQLTDYGFAIGTDGYGAGYPNLQNANNMGTASAKFLCDKVGVYDTDGFYGGFSAHPMLIDNKDYPTNGTNPVSIRHPYKWHEGMSTIWYSQDSLDETAFNIATDWNADIVRSSIIGGGIYYHAQTASGNGTARLANYITEYCQLLTAYPDVMANGTWEEMLVELKRGTGIFFDT